MHRPHYHSGPLIAIIALAMLVPSSHAQDGVSGSGIGICMDGDIRLANQTNGYTVENRMYTQGFVEICYNDAYGAICEDGWDSLDARVVCSELFTSSYDAEVVSLGRPPSDIVLQDVECSGTEMLLADCPSPGLGNVSMSCANAEFAAAVNCTEPPPPLCSEGDLMIVNTTQEYIDGFFNYGGRVEVCYNGMYAPICDQGWGEPEAMVVCGTMGYYSPSYRFEATGNQTFGLSSGTPALQDLMCSGAEYSLAECPGYDLGNVTGSRCQSGNYQAGVRCIQVPTPTVPCSDGSIRLANDSTTYDDVSIYGGRVEVCYNGTYRPVCGSDWDMDDAAVVCNNFAYYPPSYRPEATSGATFGLSDETPVLQNPMCNGTEYTLSDCPGYSLNNVSGDCLTGQNQAGVRCVELCTDGNVRLTNTSSMYMGNLFSYGGRVEVCYDGTYRPVCDLGWDMDDAAVVCNLNGYSTSSYIPEATGGSTFGLSSETPVLQNLMCIGNESTLSDCPGYSLNNVSGSYCMSGQNQAGVRCVERCTEEDIRLGNETYGNTVEGYSYVGGRVEYCENGRYGAICDIGWNQRAAQATCNQVGYPNRVARPTFGSSFGRFDGPILFQNITCDDMFNCTGLNVTDPDCNENRTAGVLCVDEPRPCTTGDLRLGNETNSVYNGANFYGGRVEVCVDGTYGPICDSGWDVNDATIVCDTLGYSSPSYRPDATGGATFGLSNETVVLQDIMCDGTEYSLSDCPGYSLNNVSGEYCMSGRNQAGVRCIEVCFNGDVRLANTSSTYMGNTFTYGGRVEVCYNETYRPVCDLGWDMDDAAVVCNLNGYGPPSYLPEATGGATFGLSDETPVLQNLMCSGTEYTLSDCPGYSLNNVSGSYCMSGQNQAGVRCVERCMEGSVRLGNETYGNTVEGYSYVGGRVEYCENGRYGAICDIGWNQRAAQAACNDAGYPDYVARPTFGSSFGRFDGPILFQNVTCDAMLNCTGLNVTDPECNENRTAGVLCVNVPRPCTDGEIRFANQIYGVFNGTDFTGGRLEVCFNGTFGPICDQGWDDQDASVVCSSFGYPPPNRRAQATFGATFGLSSQSPVLQDLMCNGTEGALSDCPGYDLGQVSGDYCQSGLNQAGVRCLEVVTPCFTEGSIVLSVTECESTPDIVDSCRSRVDYCYNGTLGSICDVGWDAADAEVVCRYQYGEGYFSEVLRGLDHGPRVPVIDNVMCNGSESSFEDCPTSQPGQVDQQCRSSQRAAGVRCYRVCYDGDVRLVGGEHRAIGRVEACQDNVWGTVCNLGWDDQDAEIACRSADFYWGGEAIANVGFGMSTAPILASNVSCNGSEYELGDCFNTTDIPAVCTHELDAAASCQPGYINMNIAYNQSIPVVAGGDITIWCNAESPSVANFTSFFWANSQGEIEDDGGRVNITIHNASYSNFYGVFIFNSSLTYSPILPTDGDLHTCNLTIGLPNVGTNISNTTSRSIRVEIPPPLVLLDTEGMPIAGTMFNATCTAAFYPGVPLEAVQMDWISVNQNSEVVNSPPRFVYGDTVQINTTHFQRTITVNPLQLMDTGNYTCRVRVGAEYVYTRFDTNITAELVVLASPVFVVEPMDVNLVVNSTSVRSNATSTSVARFTCIVSAIPPPMVNWEYIRDAGDGSIQDPRISIRNTTDSNGTVVSELTFTAVEVSDRGSFICNATNPLGSISSPAALIIFVVPEVTLEPVSATDVIEGEEIALICQVSGSWPQPTRIQWSRNRIPFSEADPRVTINTTSPTTDSYGLYNQMSRLTIPSSLADEDTGQYTCTVTLAIPDLPPLSRNIFIFVRSCRDGDVRLGNQTNGTTAEGYFYVGGRVEYCENGRYGAICDIGWNQRAAQATCDQVGFPQYVARPTFGSSFGRFDGPILFQNITCDAMLNCTGLNVTDPDCNENRTAGVLCVNEPRPCTTGDVRIANETSGVYNGIDFYGGRVEVCFNGTFGPICDQGWDDQDASVVCSSNDYPPPRNRAEATTNATFGLSSQPPVLQNIMCNGTERTLSDCPGYDLGQVSGDYCQSGLYQAGVRCLEVVTPCSPEGSIELSQVIYESSPEVIDSFRARVDYCYNGTLSGICDVGWDNFDAEVVCRQMYGEGYLSEALTGLDYGSREPVIDSVMCNGSESSFEDCPTSQPGQVDPQCRSSSRAAGVRCYRVCNDGEVRLVGGEHRAIGRVEACQDNVWGTVCNLGWDDQDAEIACRSAEFYWGGEAIANVGFGMSTAPILASNVSCNGSEYGLGACFNTTDIPAVCTHELDAAASCQPGYINMNIAYNQSIAVVAGGDVTIWCNAESPSVANFTSFFWANSQGEIVEDGRRINITIHNASFSDVYGVFIFNSSLTYSPILPTDGDLHTCNLTIGLPNVGTNISNTTSRSIRVEIPPPFLSIETEGLPVVDTTLSATCIAAFYPGVPLEAVQMAWISVNQNSELVNAPPRLMYGNTMQINATHFQRTITVNPLQLNDTGNYTCRVGVGAEYVYTQFDTNITTELIVLAPPTFVAEPMDVNLVVNSTVVRSNATSTSVARFSCIVNAIPPAMITWDYTRDAGDGSIQDPRITISTTTDSNGAVVSVLTFTAVEVSDQGSFSCGASNLVGTISSSANLRIFVEPEVTLESVSATNLTEGDEIDLSCRVSGSLPRPTQIQWLRDNIPFFESDPRVTINTTSPTTDSYGLYDQSSRLTIPSSLPGVDSGQYTCTVYVGIPDLPTLSRNIFITVQIRNECIIQLDPLVTPCVNGWCVDGINTYRCICNDGFTGRNCNQTFTMEVAPVITEPPMSTTGRAGQAINLTCTATGVPTPTITWFRDGRTIDGAVFQFLYFPSVRPEDRGYYYCRAENTNGSVQSDRVLLTLDGIQQYSAALTFPPSRRKRQVSTPAETLASQLAGQMLGDTGVTIYSATVSGVDQQTGAANLLITLAAEGDFPPGGVTGGLSDQITSTAQAAGIEVTVEITRFDGCPMELGPAYLRYFPDLRIEWPESEIGQSVTASCACGSVDTTGIDRQATRVCGGNYTDGAAWMTQDVSLCGDFSNTTLQLCQATQQPIDMQAADVADIVSDPAVVDAETFSVAADIVVDLFSSAVTNANIRDDVFSSVEGLLNVDDSVALESQTDSLSGMLLLQAIDNFTGDVMIPPGQNTLTYSQESFSIVSEQATVTGFGGRTFSTNARDNFNTNTVQTVEGTTIPNDAVASLTLPSSLFSELSITNEERRLGFSVFSGDTLFQPRPNSDAFAGLEIGGPIVSAFVRGVNVTGLTNRVSLTFQKIITNAPATCVFWDPELDSGFGGFSDVGCNTDDSANQAVCNCDHLTSFTIYVNNSAVPPSPSPTPTPITTQPTTSQPTSEPVEDDSNHSAVVFLLLSICLVILIAIVAIHLAIKALRVTDESKIIINYAIALFGLYFVTMLAYGEDMPEGACRLWAFLLVYFFLVALAWGFVEALYIVLRQAIPSFGSGFITKNFVWITMPVVWVTPIIPALISLGGLDYFGEKRLCQVYNWPFYVFMIAPFVIFYALDWIFYMATLAMMTRSTPTTSQNKFDVHRARLFHNFIAMTLSIIFGIGWAFGFLASSNDVSRGAYLTGQYLFSFLIFTHTILLLVLYLIRTSTSREELKRIWFIITCRAKEYKVSDSGSGGRSGAYITNAERGTEAITLERVEESGRHDEKVPLAQKEVEGALPIETTPVHGHTVIENPVGAKNLLAEEAEKDEEGVTSVTNQSAMEESDEEEKQMSHL